MLEFLWSPTRLGELPSRFRDFLGPLTRPRDTFLQDIGAKPPQCIVLLRETPWWDEYRARPENQQLLATLLAGYEWVGHSDLYDLYLRE